MTGKVVGTSPRRLEDFRLLRGHGRFVDDIDRQDQLWMRIVRSQVAHAHIDGIDVSKARSVPGVHSVWTHADLPELPPIPIRLQVTSEPITRALQPVLARDRVRYVGEPIAVVLADDPYVAEDAAELVELHASPLPVVLDAFTAGDAQSLWDDGGNEVVTLEMAYGDVEEAFEHAAHIVEATFDVGRHSGIPLETRGVIAESDPSDGSVTYWGLTKVAHFNRRILAGMLGLPVSKIQLRSTDAGGGFGVRGELYPEDCLAGVLTMQSGRPVKWIEDRGEHLVAANHSREQRHTLSAAFTEDGILLALRDEIWHDNGGYLRTHGATVPELTIKMLPGPYLVPAYEATVHVMTTNKTPAGTYRAPGRYEGTFVRERLFDIAAAQMGMTPISLRRKNLISRDEMPHTRPITAFGSNMILEGDYLGLLEAALEAAPWEGWQAEAEEARAEGRVLGVGVGFFLEKTGLGPYETAAIDVDTSGQVRIRTGGASIGQGIETVLAQIAADELGVDMSAVSVVHGDSDLVPEGMGSWASRSTVVGGGAVHKAAQATADKARRVAAEMLGVSEDKIDLADGRASIQNTTGESVSLGEVAAGWEPLMSARRGEPPGLGASAVFTVDDMTYPYGVHLALVEIDTETGGIEVLRYFIAYEVGRAINPQLVEGQLLGGLAQGIGGALLENFGYSADGQPQSTTFMDYLLPSASEVAPLGRVALLLCEDSPATTNPLGAHGAGEGGITGSGAAIANAVADALGDVTAIKSLPMSPEQMIVALHERALPDGP